MIRKMLAMVISALLLAVVPAGASWAGERKDVTAIVFPNGTAIFTNHGTKPQRVAVAIYAGKWKGQTTPQQLLDSTLGIVGPGKTLGIYPSIPSGIPKCGPYQVDAMLGWKVSATITFPQGTPRGLKGQAYPGNTCKPPTPTPTPTLPKSTPPTTPVAHVGLLAHTGAPLQELLVGGLLLVTLGGLASRLSTVGRHRR
jgi:hypothetical protein